MPKEIIINVPDIGSTASVDVIEVLVKVGDDIKENTPLVTLESDKASMEIPSTASGKVLSIQVKVGDKVSQGDAIVTLSSQADAPVSSEPGKAVEPEAVALVTEASPQPEPTQPGVETASPKPEPVNVVSSMVSAGPSVRRMAREFGVNLDEVQGSARNNRITKEDIQNHIKSRLSGKSGGAGLAVAAAPVIDFSQFGAVDIKALNKIKRLTGVNVHRSWVTIPHVTQFDEADITALESFRKDSAEAATKDGYKLTILAFMVALVTKALKQFPQFNASLDAQGENLIFKQYYNIGIAVDTPNGLVVPVIKNADQLTIAGIAKAMATLSQKARDKALMPGDMSGGCFTISSLGGIGGTAFTPIVNAPEVAILGLSRSSIKPKFIGGEFKPRLMLPLSLSYDHRVIDGAEAARFTNYLTELLVDIRRVLL